MEWSFGTFLWSMLVFFLWFAVVWMYIGVFADILRRHMSGWAKAAWLVLIVLVPLLGPLIYLIARPRTPEPLVPLLDPAATRPVPGYRVADEIATAARLHDEGRLTDDEFEHVKQRALRS